MQTLLSRSLEDTNKEIADVKTDIIAGVKTDIIAVKTDMIAQTSTIRS